MARDGGAVRGLEAGGGDVAERDRLDGRAWSATFQEEISRKRFAGRTTERVSRM